MIHFIVNPKAGNGRSMKAAAIIKTEMDKKQIDYKIYITNGPNHATDIAAKCIKSGADTVVAVGGDGTVLEVARGFYNKESYTFCKHVKLGIIPVGSGNDFARTVHTSSNVAKALEIILKSKNMICDMFECNGALALNIASIGVDAEIVSFTYPIKWIFGKFSYIVSIIKNIFTYKSVSGKIKIDGKILTGHFTLMAIANGKYYGGGVQIAPMASLTDAKLNLIYVDSLPWYKMMVLFPKAPSGRHMNIKQVHMMSCTQVEIDYDKNYAFNIDGDIIETNGHVEFKIHPSAIHIIHDLD